MRLKWILAGIFALAAGLQLGACDGSRGSHALEIKPFDAEFLLTREGITSLSWEDLLPEGETEELARQKQAFFAELNVKLGMLNQQSLADAARAGGYAAIEEGSELDFIPQLGTYNVVSELDNARSRIPGFVVPLQSEGADLYTEFLIVPYFGACIHTPPPPPNQIIHATTQPAIRIKHLDMPYFFEGVLKAARVESALANTAYAMELELVMAYDE